MTTIVATVSAPVQAAPALTLPTFPEVKADRYTIAGKGYDTPPNLEGAMKALWDSLPGYDPDEAMRRLAGWAFLSFPSAHWPVLEALGKLPALSETDIILAYAMRSPIYSAYQIEFMGENGSLAAHYLTALFSYSTGADLPKIACPKKRPTTDDDLKKAAKECRSAMRDAAHINYVLMEATSNYVQVFLDYDPKNNTRAGAIKKLATMWEESRPGDSLDKLADEIRMLLSCNAVCMFFGDGTGIPENADSPNGAKEKKRATECLEWSYVKALRTLVELVDDPKQNIYTIREGFGELLAEEALENAIANDLPISTGRGADLVREFSEKGTMVLDAIQRVTDEKKVVRDALLASAREAAHEAEQHFTKASDRLADASALCKMAESGTDVDKAEAKQEFDEAQKEHTRLANLAKSAKERADQLAQDAQSEDTSAAKKAAKKTKKKPVVSGGGNDTTPAEKPVAADRTAPTLRDLVKDLNPTGLGQSLAEMLCNCTDPRAALISMLEAIDRTEKGPAPFRRGTLAGKAIVIAASIIADSDRGKNAVKAYG